MPLATSFCNDTQSSDLLVPDEFSTCVPVLWVIFTQSCTGLPQPPSSSQQQGRHTRQHACWRQQHLHKGCSLVAQIRRGLREVMAQGALSEGLCQVCMPG